MKKTEFSIQNYSAFAVCFLLVHEEAAAEAVYTDIPDTVINYHMELFDIDMNNDGILDFSVLKRSFDFLATTYYSGYVTSHLSVINAGPKIAGNYIAGFTEIWGGSAAGTFTMYFPYALAEGENINDSLSFQEFGLEVVAFRYTTDKGAYSHEGGEWYPEVLDHYLGVYFKDIEGCYHYGWIRCDVKNSGKEITVKDFAYEAKCDVGIAAGDMMGDTTTVGINETNTLQATVYSFNTTIYINLNDLINKVEVHIYDLKGKEVYSGTLINQFTEIKLRESKGMYVVELISDEKQHRTDKVNLR